MNKLLAVLALMFAVGCAGTVEQSSPEPNSCELAAEEISECTGDVVTVPSSCDGAAEAAADSILERGCAALEDAKADEQGFFCRWFGWGCKPDGPASRLIEHAPQPGTYEGTDAHPALGDGSGNPCLVTVDHEAGEFFFAHVQRSSSDDGVRFLLSETYLDVQIQSDTHEYADGSGRTWQSKRATEYDEQSDAGELRLHRFDSGTFLVVVTEHGRTESCAFQP